MDFRTIIVILVVALFVIGSLYLIRMADRELHKNIQKRSDNHQMDELEASVKKVSKKKKRK